MTDSVHTVSPEQLNRLCELSRVGATCAAKALGSVIGRELLVGTVQIHWVDRYRANGRWDTGVIFETDDEISGLIALLLPTTSRDALNAAMLDENLPRSPQSTVESALREIGNIVVSQMISGVADEIGARLLPSVPSLVLSDADLVLDSMMASRGTGLHIEIELSDDSGEFHAFLVFVPEKRSE